MSISCCSQELSRIDETNLDDCSACGVFKDSDVSVIAGFSNKTCKGLFRIVSFKFQSFDGSNVKTMVLGGP